MEISGTFIEMEKEVMTKLLDGQDDKLMILRNQYRKALIKKREFSGTGFFTSFDVPNNVPKLEISKPIQLGDVIANIVDVKDGAGFVLFIKNGTLDFLEGYVYGEEKWQNQIKTYTLSYLSGIERDMDKLKGKWKQSK